MFRYVLIVFSLFMSIREARAYHIFGPQDKEGHVLTCEMWNATFSGDNEHNKVAGQFWVMGFLSGMVVADKEELLKETSPSAIFHWVDNYCSLHTNAYLPDALSSQLVKELREK